MDPIESLKPKVQALARSLIAECEKAGIPITVTRGTRTVEQQEKYYAQGRTEPGEIVTHARAGESFHNYGVAFDVRPVEFFSEEEKIAKLKKVGEIGQRLGLEWGGAWKEFFDPPHFQYSGGYSIQAFKENKVDWDKFN